MLWNPRPDKVIKYGLDALIRKYYDQGLSDASIHQAANQEINKKIISHELPIDARLSLKTIQRWRTRQSLESRYQAPKEQLHQALLEKYSQGLRDTDLASYFHLNRATIENWRKEHQLAPNRVRSGEAFRPVEETKVSIVQALLDGKNQLQISKDLAVNRGLVIQVAKDLETYMEKEFGKYWDQENIPSEDAINWAASESAGPAIKYVRESLGMDYAQFGELLTRAMQGGRSSSRKYWIGLKYHPSYIKRWETITKRPAWIDLVTIKKIADANGIRFDLLTQWAPQRIRRTLPPGRTYQPSKSLILADIPSRLPPINAPQRAWASRSQVSERRRIKLKRKLRRPESRRQKPRFVQTRMRSPNPMGQAIMLLRQASKMGTVKFAEFLGTDTTKVSEWEQGLRRPNDQQLRHLRTLARQLGILFEY